MRNITVSIVSHGHGPLLPSLISDLSSCPDIGSVIITHNIPEPCTVTKPLGFPELHIIENNQPKGFGENHNAAFRNSHAQFFAVINPDVRLLNDPFPELLDCLNEKDVSLAVPAVVRPDGGFEDSVRSMPTIKGIFYKLLRLDDGRIHFNKGDSPLSIPWAAGMFMLFKASDFEAIGGFDEGFFLYYEDVDICARLRKRLRRVMLCPSAQIVHDARRASHRNPRYLAWHLKSMLRYFRKYYTRYYRQASG